MSSTDPRPDLWARLGRILIAFLKVVLFFLLVSVLLVAGWYGYRQFISPIALRSDANKQRIELLRSDVDNLMSDTGNADAIIALESEVATLEARVADNRDTLAADLRTQQNMLAAFQLQLSGLVTTTAAQGEQLAGQQSQLFALQEDVADNSSMVDDLDRAVDQVGAGLTTLEDEFAAVREDAAKVTQMEQTLAFFRVWEMLSRARLHLFQGNAGLARMDVGRALGTVNGLVATAAQGEGAPAPPSVFELQQRLELTLQNLPSNPTVAERDLQTAWESLDELLASLLGLPEVEVTLPLTGTPPVTATVPLTQTRP